MLVESITELVGNTPLLHMQRFSDHHELAATVLAKLECFNPASSVKDRVALAMVIAAEKKGLLKRGGTIIEPTSGNTGIGLAWVAAARGYKLILTMPESMSIERRKLAAQFGAEVVLTPAAEGMTGAIARAEQLHAQIPDSFIPQQFSNSANPEAHRKTTAKEIWLDTNGKVDIFVAGVGTGGTLTGVGEALQAQNPAIQVYAVEPSDSPVLSGGKAGAHKLQGIGAGFVPENLNTKLYREVLRVGSEAAVARAREAATLEGVLVGISSGAALEGARILATRPENQGKTIVTLLPDTGERYLSTVLFD